MISDTVAVAIGRDPGATVQAVCGRRPEAVRAFQQRHGVPHATLSQDTLLADAAVDAVYIALPNHMHSAAIIAAARAGKHVLCEKSLSVDLGSSEAALTAVRAHGVFFMEALMYLTHPLMQVLLDVLPTLGQLRMVSAQYCADIARFVNPQGGGAIYNLGCYPVSLLHLVLRHTTARAPFEGLRLAAHGTHSPDGTLGEASLLMQTVDGVTAQLHCAETYGDLAACSVVGESGSLLFRTNPWLPVPTGNVFELHRLGEGARVVTVDGGADAYQTQLRLVRTCIEAGRVQAPDPAPSWQTSLDVMTLLTRWEASARQRPNG